MTEEEAEKKWCPFARSRAVEGPKIVSVWVSDISNPDAAQTTNCIASACMAWRWLPAPMEVVDRATGKSLGVKQVAYAPDEFWEHGQPTHGYCGLAGAPK